MGQPSRIVEGCPNLKSLNFTGCNQVTDGGLARIGESKKIKDAGWVRSGAGFVRSGAGLARIAPMGICAMQ